MKVSEFDFDLPPERIAQRPALPRDSARLLRVHPEGLADMGIGDLPSLLEPGDICVFNDTRVIPARLKGKRGEAGIEITLHKQETESRGHARWLVFARPAKKLKVGDGVSFNRGLEAEVEAKGEGGEVMLAFNQAPAQLLETLEAIGAMPLPPYIKRENLSDDQDAEDYQTLFADKPGAVAAPTAGLHFTPALMAALEKRGVLTARLTLHVGAGTFLPVKAEDTNDHKMHAEVGEVSQSAANAINAARATGGRVVAIGTTSLRLLESAAQGDGTVKPFCGETDIFITPGYTFKVVDIMMTNFHLPKSTLFMLVSAFAGLARMKAAYAHAIDAGYRFYSYGDACLLECEKP